MFLLDSNNKQSQTHPSSHQIQYFGGCTSVQPIIQNKKQLKKQAQNIRNPSQHVQNKNNFIHDPKTITKIAPSRHHTNGLIKFSKTNCQAQSTNLSQNPSQIMYHLSKKQNALELVYSYIALAEFYVMNQLYDPAVKILNEAQDIQETADAFYLLAVSYYKSGKKNQAYKLFSQCLERQWIQPSVSHQEANQLECITYMQRIQYERIDKIPDRRQQIQEKMIELCYQKMKIIKKYNTNRSENYYYSLAMADLAEIYIKFNQYQQASQKIKTAIKLMKGQNLGRQKLIEFYLSSATILQKLNQKAQQLTDLKNAIELIEQIRKTDKKFTKIYEDIYYQYVKKTLNV